MATPITDEDMRGATILHVLGEACDLGTVRGRGAESIDLGARRGCRDTHKFCGRSICEEPRFIALREPALSTELSLFVIT